MAERLTYSPAYLRSTGSRENAYLAVAERLTYLLTYSLTSPGSREDKYLAAEKVPEAIETHAADLIRKERRLGTSYRPTMVP